MKESDPGCQAPSCGEGMPRTQTNGLFTPSWCPPTPSLPLSVYPSFVFFAIALAIFTLEA